MAIEMVVLLALGEGEAWIPPTGTPPDEAEAEARYAVRRASNTAEYLLLQGFRRVHLVKIEPVDPD